MITLTLPEPPSSNRWHRMIVIKGQASIITSKEARDYTADAAKRARAQGCTPLSGPISVTVVWYRGRKAGDLDKRTNVFLDALQGICYENDSQIVELHAYRLDTDPAHPRIEVRIREVEAVCHGVQTSLALTRQPEAAQRVRGKSGTTTP